MSNDLQPPPGSGAADDWEREQEELLEAGLGDGLPLVPPTPERIERMLRASGFSPDEVLATLVPAYGVASWRSIAHNAVMAGCRPEYLGVVGAAVTAVSAAEFNLLGIQSTTGSAATLVIVNGPVARAIGMNAGCNALGPGNRANATIGRALRLVLQNVGGAKPGEMDMATLGQPAKYSFCLAENEAESPWEPLHVERGFSPTDGVVTVVGAAGILEVVDSHGIAPEDIAQTYAQSMVSAGSIGSGGALLGGGEPLLIIPPEHAVQFSGKGYSKNQVKALLFARAVLPLDRLSPPMKHRVLAARAAANTPDGEAPLRIAAKPEDIMILVAGGVGIKTAFVPTWGGSTRAVSRIVPRTGSAATNS